jgi:hypothetical protein
MTNSDSLTDSGKTSNQQDIHQDQRRMGPMREGHLPHRRCITQLFLRSCRTQKSGQTWVEEVRKSCEVQPVHYRLLVSNGRSHHRYDVSEELFRIQ